MNTLQIFFCSMVLLLSSIAIAQEQWAMDLHAQPGQSPGTVLVEFFPSDSNTEIVELTIKSDVSEEIVVITEFSTTITGLESGVKYFFSAVGFSAAGEGTETTPVEVVVAP